MRTIHEKILDAVGSSAFDPVLRDILLGWTEQEFMVFLADNAGKAASKLKKAADGESQRDVMTELFAARALSQIGCGLVYEPEKKGPDFKCEIRGFQWYLEVKRMRGTGEIPEPSHLSPNHPLKPERKPGDIICRTVRQIKSGHPNVLYIRSERHFIRERDIPEAMESLETHYANNDHVFFQNHGFSGCEEFSSGLSFLSVIVYDTSGDEASGSSPVMVWENRRARFLFPNWLVVLLKMALSIPFSEQQG